MRLRAVGAVLTGVALLTTVTACGGDESSGSDDKVVTIDITIKDGKVTPSGDRVDVKVDQGVDLVVTADEPGELHIHSEPEQQLDYDAGTTTLPISINRPGVVAVESHELDQVIVQLEVR